MGKETVTDNLTELISLLGAKDYNLRMKATRQLGQLADSRAVPALIELLQDGDEWVALEAANALGEIASPEALPALLDVLASKASCAEIDSLIEDGERKGDEVNKSHFAVATVQLAKDINALRAASAKALGRIGSPDAVAGLINALNDDHMTAPNKEAEWALRQIGTPVALKALEAIRN